MTGQNDADTLLTAKDLTEALNATAAEVKRLRTYGRRNRKFIVFDIVLTILLTAVSCVSVYAVQSAHDANTTAAVAASNNRNLCLSNNVARAQQIDLWDYLISLSGTKPRTAAQQKTITEFEAHLKIIFAPRDCSHTQPTNP